MTFTRFVAIDWSGARVAGPGAIALAECAPGQAAPRLIEPGRRWTRTAVLEWLVALCPERVLAGIDMSFAPPFLDAGAYLPGGPGLSTPRALWAYVDACSAADPDLGAHGFVAGHARHFYFGAASGPKRQFQRWRVCEVGFNAAGGGKASSIFDCVGAAQVGKGSFAGMRLLHRLQGRAAVWPFDPLPETGPVLVEIYTRAMIRHAGLRGLKLRDAASLDAALAAFGAEPTRHPGPLSDHQTDVLLSAAALRALTHQPQFWNPPGLTPQVRATEGWTFGVA